MAVDNANLFGATRRGEADQRRLNEELRETVHLNELFVAVLARRRFLRSPLAAVYLGRSDPVAPTGGRRASRHEKALLRLTTSGQRMTRMIEQILDFTRLRVGGLTLEPRASELGPLVREVADELEGAGIGHPIEIAQLGDGAGRWDPDRLGQVFSYLLANALQHGGPQGGAQAHGVHVQIDGSLPDTVRVRVHNAGAIPAELIPRIFDPMIAGDWRRDGSRGLGLVVRSRSGSSRRTAARSTSCRPRAPVRRSTVTLPRFTQAPRVGIFWANRR